MKSCLHTVFFLFYYRKHIPSVPMLNTMSRLLHDQHTSDWVLSLFVQLSLHEKKTQLWLDVQQYLPSAYLAPHSHLIFILERTVFDYVIDKNDESTKMKQQYVDGKLNCETVLRQAVDLKSLVWFISQINWCDWSWRFWQVLVQVNPSDQNMWSLL